MIIIENKYDFNLRIVMEGLKKEVLANFLLIGMTGFALQAGYTA